MWSVWEDPLSFLTKWFSTFIHPAFWLGTGMIVVYVWVRRRYELKTFHRCFGTQVGFVASDNLLVVDCRFGRFPVFVRGRWEIQPGDWFMVWSLTLLCRLWTAFCLSCLFCRHVMPGSLLRDGNNVAGSFPGPRNGVCFPCPGLVMADCRQPLVGMGFDPLGWGKRSLSGPSQ